MNNYYSFGQIEQDRQAHVAPPSSDLPVAKLPSLAPQPGMATIDIARIQKMAAEGQLRLTQQRTSTPTTGVGKVLPLAAGALVVLMLLR